MRINFVCEVITHVSLLQAWRGLGSPHSVRIRCFGSSNSWRSTSNTTSWNFGVAKASKRPSAAKRTWFLHAARFVIRPARSSASHHVQLSACGVDAGRYVEDKVWQVDSPCIQQYPRCRHKVEGFGCKIQQFEVRGCYGRSSSR